MFYALKTDAVPVSSIDCESCMANRMATRRKGPYCCYGATWLDHALAVKSGDVHVCRIFWQSWLNRV